MKKSKKIITVSLIMTALGISAASAHVEFNPDTVQAGKHLVLNINLPHDCTDATMTKEIKLLIPSNVNTMKLMPLAVKQHGKVLSGWSEKVVTISGKNYLDVKGPATKFGPDSGPNGGSIGFMMTTPNTPGKQLKLPAVQLCTNNQKVNWVQPRPADGSDPAESATPVPVINLTK